jgi:hypothetical protein
VAGGDDAATSRQPYQTSLTSPVKSAYGRQTSSRASPRVCALDDIEQSAVELEQTRCLVLVLADRSRTARPGKSTVRPLKGLHLDRTPAGQIQERDRVWSSVGSWETQHVVTRFEDGNVVGRDFGNFVVGVEQGR